MNIFLQPVGHCDLARLHLLHKTYWVDSSLDSTIECIYSTCCTYKDHVTFILEWWCNISNLEYLIEQISQFEISEVHEIGLPRFRIRKSEFVAKTQFLTFIIRKILLTFIVSQKYYLYANCILSDLRRSAKFHFLKYLK